MCQQVQMTGYFIWGTIEYPVVVRRTKMLSLVVYMH